LKLDLNGDLHSLASRTFARKFGSVLESHRKNAGLQIPSKRLSNDYIARAKETFLNVLSSDRTEILWRSMTLQKIYTPALGCLCRSSSLLSRALRQLSEKTSGWHDMNPA
jgi:hypothetical protein